MPWSSCFLPVDDVQLRLSLAFPHGADAYWEMAEHTSWVQTSLLLLPQDSLLSRNSGFLPPPRTLFIRAPLYQSSLNKTVSSFSYSPDSNGSDLVSHLRFLLTVTRLLGPPCSVPAGTPGDGEFYSWSCARDPAPSGAWCGFELGPLSTCLIVVAESFGFVIWLISWSILCPNQLRISGPAGSDQFCVLCVYAWFVAAVLELKLSSFPLCL